MENLRHKLGDALSILEANHAVALTILEHSNGLQRHLKIANIKDIDEYFLTELRQYISAIEGHIRSVNKLLKFSEDVRLLVCGKKNFHIYT